MDRRLLILGAAIVIVALIVGAAPVAGSQTTLLKKILKSVQALQEPTGYEYYTPAIFPPQTKSFAAVEYLTNCGDSPAEASYYKYEKNGSQPWVLAHSYNVTLQPGQLRGCSPTVVMPYYYSYRFKVTTNSKYIVPYAQYSYTDGSGLIDNYLPGDFQKIEIYG